MKQVLWKFFVFIASLSLAGCGAGQVLGPTYTPFPTSTPTATSTNTFTLTPTFTPTLTLTPTFTPSPTSTPIIGGGSGKIAFSNLPYVLVGDTWRQNVWIVNSDGSGLFQLTFDDIDYFNSWFPDGKRIIFYNSEKNRFYTINTDSTNMNQIEFDFWLGNSIHGIPGLRISPDGTKVAFSLPLDNGKSDLYIANFDGERVSRPVRLGNGNYPDWSPDGTKLVYDDGTDYPQIYEINIDGTKKVYLSGFLHLGGTEAFPSWSPDGSRIVFTNFPYNREGSGKIYVMNLDGKNLIDLGVEGWMADWSPDGTKITFLHYPNINMMNADGTDVRLLVDCDQCYVPYWAP